MLKLIVESELGLGDEYSISGEKKVIIGRGESANIQIQYDQLSSRENCEIYFSDSDFYIKDLNSANGTQLNQENILKSVIQESDVIGIGNTIFRAKIESVHRHNSQTELAAEVNDAKSSSETFVLPEFILFDDTEEKQTSTLIDNQSNFEVEILPWPDFKGKTVLSIIAKITYKIEVGEAPTISDKTIPVFKQIAYFDGDYSGSIMYETDLVPFKPLTDIVVVGNAYTPDQEPLSRLDAGIKVGETQKVIRVFGDRNWYQPEEDAEFIISEPEVFTSMELKYEKSFGGKDIANEVNFRDNPIGCGCVVEKSLKNSELRKLPNLENPLDLIETLESRPKPVGFGFYSQVWTPRLELLGSYEKAPPEYDQSFFPMDFSYQFFNAAHPDLQVEGYLKGNEKVELVNLSAKGRLIFNLPDNKPEVFVGKKNPSTESIDNIECDKSHIQMNLDTLVFIPEEDVFYQVFRGIYQLGSMEELQKISIQVRDLEQ